MNTGTLTPRSNDSVDEMRFSGGFGQPDGFSSVLTVSVRRSGDVALILNYRVHGNEQMWSVMLTNEQRNVLAEMIGRYQPTLHEVVV